MTDPNYFDELFASEERGQAASAAAAHARAEAGRAFRKAHWDKIEEKSAADRRRAAGLTPDDHAKVNRFIEHMQHVDALRLKGKIPEAVEAWRKMGAAADEHDPADENGNQRLWKFASREIRERYQHAYPECRLVKPGFEEFCADCASGWYENLTVEPQPATSGSAT